MSSFSTLLRVCLPFPFCSCAMSTFSTQLRFVYFFHAAPLRLLSCADPGIFVRGGGGGVQVNPTKKALTTFFFSPHLILQKSNVYFQRKLSFFKVQEGVQLFPGGGGGPTFSREGSNCLFPIEPHMTCDFPGGSGNPCPTPPPPLDPPLTFSTFPTLLWYVYFSMLLHHHPPPPRRQFLDPRIHVQFMYIYHFLLSWIGRDFEYWHTNRVGSTLSAAHTFFYGTPSSQRACALAFMSPFSTVSVFYVTPARISCAA